MWNIFTRGLLKQEQKDSAKGGNVFSERQNSPQMNMKRKSVSEVEVIIKKEFQKKSGRRSFSPTSRSTPSRLNISRARESLQDVRSKIEKNNLDPFQKTRDGMSAFHLACIQGDAELVNFFITKYPRILKIRNNKNQTGFDALYSLKETHEITFRRNFRGLVFTCVKEGYLFLLKQIHNNSQLKKGFTTCINAPDINGNVALHFACERGDLEMAIFLIDSNSHIHSKNKLGYSALHIACEKGMYKMIELLLNKGADIAQKCKKNKKTAMDLLVDVEERKVRNLKDAKTYKEKFNVLLKGFENLKNHDMQIAAMVLEHQRLFRDGNVIKTQKYIILVEEMIKALFLVIKCVGIRRVFECEIELLRETEKKIKKRTNVVLVEVIKYDQDNRQKLLNLMKKIENVQKLCAKVRKTYENYVEMEKREIEEEKKELINNKSNGNDCDNDKYVEIIEKRMNNRKFIMQNYVNCMKMLKMQNIELKKLYSEKEKLRKVSKNLEKEKDGVKHSINNDKELLHDRKFIMENIDGLLPNFFLQIEKKKNFYFYQFKVLHKARKLCKSFHRHTIDFLEDLKFNFIHHFELSYQFVVAIEEKREILLKHLLEIKGLIEEHCKSFVYVIQKISASYEVYEKMSFAEAFRKMFKYKNFKSILTEDVRIRNSFNGNNSNERKSIKIKYLSEVERKKIFLKVLFSFKGHDDIVENLLRAKLLNENDAIDEKGNTILHYCSFLGNAKYVEQLLFYGFDYEIENNKGKIARQMATVEIIKLIHIYDKTIFQSIICEKRLNKHCDLILDGNSNKYDTNNAIKKESLNKFKEDAISCRNQIRTFLNGKQVHSRIVEDMNDFFNDMERGAIAQQYFKLHNDSKITSNKKYLRYLFTFPCNEGIISKILKVNKNNKKKVLDKNLNTPIHYACFFQNYSYIRELLRDKADVLKKNKKKVYPFQYFDEKNNNNPYFYQLCFYYGYEGTVDNRTFMYSGQGRLYRFVKRIFQSQTKVLQYFGEWKYGKKNGKGREFYKDGQVKYYGKFKNNKKHGYGTEYDKKGRITQKGEWREGKFYKNLEVDPVIRETDLTKFKLQVLDNEEERQKRFIGKGSYGEVYRYDQKHAVKVFFQFLNENEKEKVKKEIRLMFRLRHPNVLRIYSCSLKMPFGILTELCECSIAKLIRQRGIEWNEKIRILYETSLGMEFLHMNHVIHRDLKWDNVMITKRPLRRIKIIDFGFAKIHESFRFSVKNSFLGTYDYLAPEILTGEYDYKVDVFAFGIMMYELICETLDPYEKGRNKDNSRFWGVNISHEVKKGLRPDLRRVPNREKKETKWYIDLMKMCWDPKPLLRPSFCQIIQVISSHM